MTIHLLEATLFLIGRNSSNKDQSFSQFCFMKALFYAAAFLAFLTDEKIVGADPLPSGPVGHGRGCRWAVAHMSLFSLMSRLEARMARTAQNLSKPDELTSTRS